MGVFAIWGTETERWLEPHSQNLLKTYVIWQDRVTQGEAGSKNVGFINMIFLYDPCLRFGTSDSRTLANILGDILLMILSACGSG